MKIKAYAIFHKGGEARPFFYEKKLGRDDVLVKITHCGIPRGDIHFIDNDWGDTRYPLVTGQEAVGVVEKVGANVVDLKVGDRVGLGYQQDACFKCQFCKHGQEQFCLDQKVAEIHCEGYLADHAIVDGRFVFKLPKGLNAARSTPLFTSGLTVYTAIVQSNLERDAEVAVLGVGGLGHLAIQFLRAMDHKVWAFSHTPKKKLLIKELGARYVDSLNPKNSLIFKRKFDFILSTLNVDFDLNTYLSMLKPQGKICLVGLPLTPLSFKVDLLADYAQRTICGNYIGSRQDMKDMLAFATKHQIQAKVKVMPFSRMNQAIKLVRNKEIPVRLVLENRT